MWVMVLKWLGLPKQAKATSTVVQKEPFIDVPLAAEPCVEVVQPPTLQVNGGSNNLQVGQAGGDVVSQVSHHSHVHSHAHNHTHSHVTVVQTSAQAPANEPQVRKPSSAEQSATLRRMNQLNMDKRIRVLNFMESKFGTRMVIELKAEQLNLLNRYLEPVMKDTRNLKDAGPARAA